MKLDVYGDLPPYLPRKRTNPGKGKIIEHNDNNNDTIVYKAFSDQSSQPRVGPFLVQPPPPPHALIPRGVRLLSRGTFFIIAGEGRCVVMRRVVSYPSTGSLTQWGILPPLLPSPHVWMCHWIREVGARMKEIILT